MQQSGDRGWLALREQSRAEFRQGLFGFSQQDEVDAVLEVLFGVIGCVGAMCDHDRSRSPSGCGELHGNLAHSGEAHLGEEVEIIFVDDDDLRMMMAERFRDPWL